MDENNFEKQVREKMDQLGFDPSDKVWAGVDKEINKEKKRRRPLFWLFFLSGLVLAGGAIYFAGIKSNSSPEQTNSPKTIPDKNTVNRAANKPEINPPANSTDDEANRALSKMIASGNRNRKLRSKTFSEKNNSVNGKENASGGRLSKTAVPDFTKQSNLNSPKSEKNIPAVKSGNGNDQVNKNDQDTKTGLLEKPAEASVALNSVNGEVNSKNKPGPGTSMDSAKTINKDSLTTAKVSPEKTEKKKSPTWKIGYTGTAGFSAVNQDLFKSINSTYPAYNTNAAAAPPPVNPAPNNYTSSEITTGFSFSLGAFVNRDLSKRISLSAGLGYHYYSTKIQTGNFVDSSSNIYLPSIPGYANSYYRNGKSQSYSNQYHFIELPVTVNFQLNKSNTRPVVWEAGLSLAYLISSNALFFDPASNVYYQSSQSMNKTQLNGLTAVMVGFPMGKSTLQLGPQLQYGFTGLLKNSNGNPGHLVNYGLKISYIPGKK